LQIALGEEDENLRRAKFDFHVSLLFVTYYLLFDICYPSF
jgi:hypothetical protein